MNKTFDQSKDEIAKLCYYFEVNRKSFFAPGVKEAHVRQSLIDPFFETLGWDVRNSLRNAPQYREVVPEDSLDDEGHQKAPDYTFRVGTTPKFYAEAKKCGVNINVDLGPAYQLRRYAFSAKLALSILTDFEELSIYECSSRPKPSDKASHSRILYFRFDEYPDNWRAIWDIFSREAVWSGSFDQYISSKRKRGTSEVDTEFLKDIEHWREELARNLALRNGNLSVEELNSSVQLIIDRIVFLRMAEDRGLEPYEQLLKLCEQPDIYRNFITKLCRKADEKYNSGLFHFHKEAGIVDVPDTITPHLAIDDKIIKPIIQNLYFEFGSPYHFGVLPVEILGTVYERFLGKVIRLTAGHQAKVEEKPEVRKAGGVYYTPSYIVEYIVKNTVGKQVEGKSPAQIAKGVDGQPIRILDMACGSGSFLLGAYQYLLDHCLKWYENNQPEKHPKAVFQDTKGIWRLTISERKRILTIHIYGVDIDRQAVEVTKLSLLIKALEGENDATLTQQMQIFQERALPNLSNNIKCGNSLIGPDYFEGKLFPDAEELNRINPFAWKAEFPEAMKSGGFDCVIGNPPYVRSINLKQSDPFLWDLYRSQYQSAADREWDIYLIFVEKGLALLKAQGKLGYILPNKFLNSLVGNNLRNLLAHGNYLERIVHFGAFQIFQRATTYTCLLFLNRQSQLSSNIARYIGPVNNANAICPLPEDIPSVWAFSEISNEKLSENAWIFSRSDGTLLDKLKRWPALENVSLVFQGTGTRADKVFVVECREKNNKTIRIYSAELESEYLLESIYIKKAFRGRNIGRYMVKDDSTCLLVPYELFSSKYSLVPENKLATHSPKTFEYLYKCKLRLDQREDGRFKGEGWYCFGRPQNMERFEVPEKIVLPDVAFRGTCYIDREQNWLLDTAYGIIPKPSNQLDLRFLLAILNSPLLTFYLRETGTALRGGYFRMKTAYLNPFPLRSIEMSDHSDKLLYEKVIGLVEQMLSLHKRKAAAPDIAGQERLQRLIDSTDKQIDSLVYELYGLTQEEIEIVESTNTK